MVQRLKGRSLMTSTYRPWHTYTCMWTQVYTHTHTHSLSFICLSLSLSLSLKTKAKQNVEGHLRMTPQHWPLVSIYTHISEYTCTCALPHIPGESIKKHLIGSYEMVASVINMLLLGKLFLICWVLIYTTQQWSACIIKIYILIYMYWNFYWSMMM